MKRAPHPFKTSIFFPALMFLLVFLDVCGGSILNAETGERRPLPGKLLVLPFHNMAELYGTNVSIRCPICGKIFISGDVPDKPAQKLGEKLLSMLREGKYYQRIVAGDSHWGGPDLLSKDKKILSEIELLQAAGRSAGADVVMVGYIYRYQERIGSRISVDTPASVAFGLHLIDVKTGRQLWRGYVDETQRTLSENLFNINKFIKRKASWITADEMATSGLKEILQTLPKK